MKKEPVFLYKCSDLDKRGEFVIRQGNSSPGILKIQVLAGWCFVACIAMLYSGQPYAENLAISASQVPPYHTDDRTGFEDQVAIEIYNRLGYKISLHDVPPARALTLINDGIDDGSIARNPNLQKNFPNLVQFSEHALERQYVAYTLDPDLEIKKWRDLEDYSVGIVLGWKILERNITQSKSLTKVKNGKLLFRLLKKERVDVVVFNKWGGLQLVDDLGLENVIMLEPPLAARKVYFYLNKRHAELAEKASEALREMKADGTYDRLVDEILLPLSQ